MPPLQPQEGEAQNTRVRCDIPDCFQDFGRLQEMERHKDERHGGPKKCPFCAHSTKRKQRLLDHIDEKHRPKKHKQRSSNNPSSHKLPQKNIAIHQIRGQMQPQAVGELSIPENGGFHTPNMSFNNWLPVKHNFDITPTLTSESSGQFSSQARHGMSNNDMIDGCDSHGLPCNMGLEIRRSDDELRLAMQKTYQKFPPKALQMTSHMPVSTRDTPANLSMNRTLSIEGNACIQDYLLDPFEALPTSQSRDQSDGMSSSAAYQHAYCLQQDAFAVPPRRGFISPCPPDQEPFNASEQTLTPSSSTAIYVSTSKSPQNPSESTAQLQPHNAIFTPSDVEWNQTCFKEDDKSTDSWQRHY